MNPLTAINLVAKREITTRMRSKAVIWTTIILLIAIVAGSFIASVLSDKEPSADHVGVTNEALLPAMESAAATTGTLVEVQATSAEEGEALLRDDSLDALVAADADGAVTVTTLEALPMSLDPTMAVLAQQMALDSAITELGGDPSTVNTEVLGAEPTIISLETSPDDEVAVGQAVTGMITGILIFLAVMTTGQMVAQGVVEEKSSRVVELLLSTIQPWQLIAGKILGIGLIGLIQMALFAGVGALSAAGFGLLDGTDVQLGSTVLWLLVWFLLGYAMYATMLGGLASLVSRQEDVGAVLMPAIALLMIPYVVGVSVAPWEPNNTLVVVLSLIPFFSPMLMPIRIALESAAGWEIALTVGLSVLLIGLLVLAAGKIYSRAVLRTGAKVSLREVLGKD